MDYSFIANPQQTKIDIPDPTKDFLQAIQIKDMLSKSKLNDMALQDDAAARQAFSSSGGDATKYLQALASNGNYKQYQDALKHQLETKKANVGIDKDSAEIATKRLTAFRDIAPTISNPEQARTWMSAQYNDPYLGSIMKAHGTLDEVLSRIPTDPEGLKAWTQQNALGMTKFIEQNKPSYHTQNLGNTSQIVATPGLGGAPNVVSSSAINQSPDSVATNETSRANNAATIANQKELDRLRRAQTESHFQQNQNTPQYMETDAGLVALPKRLGAGQAPIGTPVMGADGQPLGKPLKQVPASVNTAIIANNQAKNQLDRALKLLNGENIGNPSEGGMQGDKAATGWKGMLPQAILNRVDPSGVATRAEIADIGSLKLHDRSGAAVTASESPRLMPFIPTASDDAATVKKKLQRLKLEIDNESKAMGEFYGKDQGYRAPPSLGGGIAKPAPLSGADAQAAEWAKSNPNDPRAAAIKQRLGL